MALLADLLAFFHLLIVLFAVFGEAAIIIGGFLNWKWIRKLIFRLTHLGLIIYVALEASLGILCPLTLWEHALRRAAGQKTDTDITFIGKLIRSLLFWDFPSELFTWLYIGFGAVVATSFILVPPRWKRD